MRSAVRTRFSSSSPVRAAAGSHATSSAPRPSASPRCAMSSSSGLRRCRAHQREVLPIEPADEALGPFALRAAEEELVAVPAAGPVFASLEDLPEMPVDTFVLANELLDNLPFGIAQWDGARWDEVRVAVDGSRFVEILVPASDSDASALTRVVDGRDLPPRTRLPIPRGVEAWLDECGQAMHTGVVVLVDYFVDVDELLARGGDWLRTFRGHERGSDPLDAPGSQDITSDVLRGHVERAAAAAGFSIVADRTQADWLRDLGLDELVADGRRDVGRRRGARRPRRARRTQPSRGRCRAHRRRRARRAPRRHVGEAAPDRAVRTPVASTATGGIPTRKGNLAWRRRSRHCSRRVGRSRLRSNSARTR